MSTTKKRVLIDIPNHARYKKLVSQIPISEIENYTVKTHTEMLIEQWLKKNDVQIELFEASKKPRKKAV